MSGSGFHQTKVRRCIYATRILRDYKLFSYSQEVDTFIVYFECKKLFIYTQIHKFTHSSRCQQASLTMTFAPLLKEDPFYPLFLASIFHLSFLARFQLCDKSGNSVLSIFWIKGYFSGSAENAERKIQRTV